MLTFDISHFPESVSELPRYPFVERVFRGMNMFQIGDHLIARTGRIDRHAIVNYCDRANVDVVFFDETGPHCTPIWVLFWEPGVQCYRVNYAHYDETAREDVIARVEAFTEPPGLGTHNLANEPEDYLAYCLTGAWNVPRKQVPLGPPPELPPLPPPFQKFRLV